MVKAKNKVLVFTTPKRVELVLFFWFPCFKSSTLPISLRSSGLTLQACLYHLSLLFTPGFGSKAYLTGGLFKSSTTTVVIQLDNLLTPNQNPFRSQIFPVFQSGTPKIIKMILYIIVYHIVMKNTRRDRGSQEVVVDFLMHISG